MPPRPHQSTNNELASTLKRIEEKPSFAIGKLEWGVIASLLISASSVIFSAGVVYSKVQQQEIRLVAVEVKSDGVSERLGRIETNVEWLVQHSRQERPDRRAEQ